MTSRRFFLFFAVVTSLATTAQKRSIPAHGYLELHWVIRDSTVLRDPNCVVPNGKDLGTVSVHQQGGIFQDARFVDFVCGRLWLGPRAENAATNLCAARDLGSLVSPNTIPGVPANTVNRCTGMVVIGKERNASYFLDFTGFNYVTLTNPPVLSPGIDETGPYQEIGGFFLTPQPNGTQGWLDPLTQSPGGASFQMATQWGRPDAMDVAIALTSQGSSRQLESWVIVAENRPGGYPSKLVAYYLSGTMNLTTVGGRPAFTLPAVTARTVPPRTSCSCRPSRPRRSRTRVTSWWPATPWGTAPGSCSWTVRLRSIRWCTSWTSRWASTGPARHSGRW